MKRAVNGIAGICIRKYKKDGEKYNGDINIYFQDEDKTLHITVILYEDMIENENTSMR